MDIYEGGSVMSRNQLEKMNDEELNKLLPEGLDIIDYTPDYTKSSEENREIIRQRKIEAILNK